MHSQAKYHSIRPIIRLTHGRHRWRSREWTVFFGLATLWFALGGRAVEVANSRVESAFSAAQAAVAATNSVVHRWQLARAAFDLADVTPREKEKARLAEIGRAASRAAIKESPANAPAHYYLALCSGELAQAKAVGGLRLIHEIQSEFEAARVLDENFDHAGPDRGLGLLFLEAPGWPTSVGDRKKARAHLERAVVLAPEYPENRLALLDLMVRVKDHRGAVAQMAAIESMWSKAKAQLTGEEWASAWRDWEHRKTVLGGKVLKLSNKTSVVPR